MDGKELLYMMRQLINESSTSAWIDDKTSYYLLNEAAHDLNNRIEFLKTTQSISTVADQQTYTVNADFMRLYLKNSSNNFYLKYNDGSTDHFLTWKAYEDITYNNNTDSVTVPSRFSIINNSSLASRVTGTCTSAGTLSGGEATLTDSNGDFSNVNAGDIIHNTTDGSDGIVISKTSSTVLVTALFGGTDNDWDSSDAYIIQPQGRFLLVLDPPPSTANHTITLYYVQRPLPVYSDYRVFGWPSYYDNALVKYAAWLYKYRDKDPNFGDKFYVTYDNEVRRLAVQSNRSFNRKGFTMNLKKRA